MFLAGSVTSRVIYVDLITFFLDFGYYIMVSLLHNWFFFVFACFRFAVSWAPSEAISCIKSGLTCGSMLVSRLVQVCLLYLLCSCPCLTWECNGCPLVCVLPHSTFFPDWLLNSLVFFGPVAATFSVDSCCLEQSFNILWKFIWAVFTNTVVLSLSLLSALGCTDVVFSPNHFQCCCHCHLLHNLPHYHVCFFVLRHLLCPVLQVLHYWNQSWEFSNFSDCLDNHQKHDSM